MICENCKKHIERKFLAAGKTVNCLNYSCERHYLNQQLIECTRDEICDYIYQILQPERSKREDRYRGGYFPPPWNIYEHPEKTEGWIAFQEAQRKDPNYYGCGTLNTDESQ